MHCKVILSETARCCTNVEAIIAGEDEKQVEFNAEVKFKQLIKEKNENLSDDEIQDCILNGTYSDLEEEGDEYCLLLMNPECLIQV